MKTLIIANWKMNPTTLTEAKRTFDLVKKGIRGIRKAEVIICPPFPFLTSIKYQVSSIKLGGQDCFWENPPAGGGAYTGEISPLMLKNLGCEYVILGHSERRKYFGETEEIINKKIKAALKAKLKPIFCIGETQEEKDMEKTQDILKFQLSEGLKKISKKEIKNIVIAYEPVWAIGTGNACDTEMAMSALLIIKKVISQPYDNSTAQNLRILYGGSVNSQNAAGYIKDAGFVGLLVGGASLNPKEFVKIVKSV